ncbi:hypothetical protein DPEC_G00067280 [Dallia pectoralis]|uniref:Uncharacterized protein n=1 Tax=Dallia pectoralis TaxID=75939 RepID=A0ACC2H9J5_DALPE|nr:hypothetical protein DPEC_G00067280 [Dallia pectoralis]
MKRLYNHVLFNGRKMVCVSADNPAVTTLLELTEANCVPPNQNITVIIKAKDSISTQRYTRDLAMAAVFCFAGGVGLTLAVVYIIYFKLRMNKSLKTWREGPGAEEQDKGRPAKTQTVTQVDLDEEYQVINMAQMGLETKLMLPNSNKKGSFVEPWDQERVLTNPRIGPAHRHFLCPQCKVTVNGSAVVQKRGPDGLFGTALNMIIQGAAHPKKSLAMTEESDVTDQSSWIRSAEAGLSGAHPEESGPAEYQKTDLSQKGIGGTEDSSGGLIPSHLSLSQSDSNKPVGSSVQQVGQYEGHLTTEIQHLSYHGDEVAVQKTRSDPQQSTTPALTGMECISTISNLPVQGGTSIVSQSTFAPYNAYDGHLLDGQNIAQLVQGSGYLNEQNISQIARGPGSVDGQNISQLAQSLESLDGDNLSNNSKNPAPVLQEILASAEGSPRKIRLVMPERTPNRPPSALEKKIR